MVVYLLCDVHDLLLLNAVSFVMAPSFVSTLKGQFTPSAFFVSFTDCLKFVDSKGFYTEIQLGKYS